MAHKAFYVTRTEDEQMRTAGAATLNRADVPPLVKVFDDESDIVLSTLSTNEIVATKNTDYSSVAVVDRVAEGNLNPVTSNAVASHFTLGALEEITLSNNIAAPTEISEPGFIIIDCNFIDHMNNTKQTFININSKVLNVCSLDSTNSSYTIIKGTTTIPVAAGDLVACYGKNGSGSNPGTSTKVYFRPFGFIA